MKDIKYIFIGFGVILMIASFVCLAVMMFTDVAETRNTLLGVCFAAFTLGSINVLFAPNEQ